MCQNSFRILALILQPKPSVHRSTISSYLDAIWISIQRNSTFIRQVEPEEDNFSSSLNLAVKSISLGFLSLIHSLIYVVKNKGLNYAGSVLCSRFKVLDHFTLRESNLAYVPAQPKITV